MIDTEAPRAHGEDDRWDCCPYCQGTSWREKGKAEYLKRRKAPEPRPQ